MNKSGCLTWRDKSLQLIVDQLHDTMAEVREVELRLTRWHRQSQVSQLLATVPGIGIMGASAIAATVADPSLFRSGREFAAWLGRTPRQNSSGGKERLGRTSKRGDKYIRSLLIAGAVAPLAAYSLNDFLCCHSFQVAPLLPTVRAFSNRGKIAAVQTDIAEFHVGEMIQLLELGRSPVTCR